MVSMNADASDDQTAATVATRHCSASVGNVMCMHECARLSPPSPAFHKDHLPGGAVLRQCVVVP